MTETEIGAVICAAAFLAVLVWGLIRLYFAEKEASLKRVIKMTKGDDEHEQI